MSHLLFWPSVIFFYPVGNTSAICLTENLSPEAKADILLLACGDPRHILYTIYANETNPLTCQRKLDITCCDVDAAILARNVLLFTFLADDDALDKSDSLWNLFYHLFVDKPTLSMLFQQCRKLISLAEDLETWRAGPYGHFLSACDAGTLANLQCIWTSYLDTSALSSKQAKQFEQRFEAGMKEMTRRTSGGTTTASRSAGPLGLHVGECLSRHFDNYWVSGTTDDQGDAQKKLTFNPTFAFSIDGDKFAVHYGTDPLCGFHLAEAFATGKFIGSDEQTSQVIRIAKEQFSRWCTSVSKRLKHSNPSSPTFIIRMFAGDVLMFCQALKYCEEMRSPITPYNIASWRLSTILLDDHCYGQNAVSPAPLSFNVIDTSNILDHVGLVNILVVTAPLLQKSPSARLYTEALLKTGGDPLQGIYEHICGDLPTMSLLLGIIPSTLISQFTTRSNIHENFNVSSASRQYYERLAWQVTDIGGPHTEHNSRDVSATSKCLSITSKDLANILFHTYLQMFAYEDSKNRFQRFLTLSSERKFHTLQQSGNLHYTRRSFALLVHFVKTRVKTDWLHTMEMFEQLVMTDRQLLTGQQAYQELCCQFFLLGLYTTEWISLPSLRTSYREYNAHSGPFRDWSAPRIPQVVTLVLVVPRDVIAKLERDFEEVGTPMLHCQMDDGPRQNWFAVTAATFGTLRVSGKGEHRSATIIEGSTDTGAGTRIVGTQPLRRSGAPMIVTVSVPAASLMDFGRNPNATIGLGLIATPPVSFKFMQKLGFSLVMYKTTLTDAKRVFVLTQPPVVRTSANVGGAVDATEYPVMAGHWQVDKGEEPAAGKALGSTNTAQNADTNMQVQMNDTCSTVQSFTIRIDVTELSAQAVLADSKTLPTVASTMSPTRSVNACLRIGNYAFPLQFPLPIDATRAKLRVARRSSYVEVIAPLALFDVRSEHDLSTRLVSAPNEDGRPTLRSIHYLNLDRCPTFNVSTSMGPSELDWCHLHISLMYSEMEQKCALSDETQRSSIASSSSTTPDTLLHVKQTLEPLLRTAAAATRGGKVPGSMFALCDTSRGHEKPYLFVIVARMRLDVGSHTIVADAFVVPTSTPIVREAITHTCATKGGLRGLGDTDGVHYIVTGADETAAWFHLVPCLTERCRTWPHKTGCACRASKSEKSGEEVTPIERWEMESPLCGCGAGVGTEILPKAFERVAPYLTRAAISPLFSVPYLKGVDASAAGNSLVSSGSKEGRGAAVPAIKTDATQGGLSQGNTAGTGHQCRSCGKQGSLVCSGCKRVRYCSKECQRKDWKTHKKDCVK